MNIFHFPAHAVLAHITLFFTQQLNLFQQWTVLDIIAYSWPVINCEWTEDGQGAWLRRTRQGSRATSKGVHLISSYRCRPLMHNWGTGIKTSDDVHQNACVHTHTHTPFNIVPTTYTHTIPFYIVQPQTQIHTNMRSHTDTHTCTFTHRADKCGDKCVFLKQATAPISFAFLVFSSNYITPSCLRKIPPFFTMEAFTQALNCVYKSQ